MKTYTGCNTRYKHNNSTINPADCRARTVANEHSGKKFKKLDKQFTADVVGDVDNNIVGPFQAAQSRFHKGGVIPLCAGWFGEIGGDFEKVIRLLAQEAAASNDGMTISPLVNRIEREEPTQSCYNNSGEQLE